MSRLNSAIGGSVRYRKAVTPVSETRRSFSNTNLIINKRPSARKTLTEEHVIYEPNFGGFRVPKTPIFKNSVSTPRSSGYYHHHQPSENSSSRTIIGKGKNPTNFNPKSKSSRPTKVNSGNGGGGDCVKSESVNNFCTSNDNETIMVSVGVKPDQMQLSLLEQKRMQWAKEREEQNGLWCPWGRASESKSTSALHDTSLSSSQPKNPIPLSAYNIAKLGLSSQAAFISQSECYLPPINKQLEKEQSRQQAAHIHRERIQQEQRSATWAVKQVNNNLKNDQNHKQQLSNRKSSLPNEYTIHMNNGVEGYRHPRQSPQQSFEDEDGAGGDAHFKNYNNSVEWIQFDPDQNQGEGQRENNNHFHHRTGTAGGGQHTQGEYNRDWNGETEYESKQLHYVEGIGRSSNSKGTSPRVIVHKIYVDSPPASRGGGGQRSMNFNRAEGQDGGRKMSEQEIYNMVNVVEDNGRQEQASLIKNGNLVNVSKSFGGSTGYMNSPAPWNNVKPPPVAMRSSLTIGIDSSYSSNFEDIEKKEREEWLNELDKQREEQRIKKLMEKDDKRARWGDRGVGVGHFWEPSDSTTARLPPTPKSRDGNNNSNNERGQPPAQLSPTPPPWLERSLTRMQSSKSQPNLIANDAEELLSSRLMTANANNQNLFINQSSVDLRSFTGLSPESEERTFLRGQNVPIDPDLFAEKEKRRIANQEHLEAIKQQIAEREEKKKAERDAQIREEQQHEARMAHQRELELKRLEMEKRKRSGYSDSNNNQNNQSTNSKQNGQKQRKGAHDIPVEIHEPGRPRQNSRNQMEEKQPQHESPLIPHQVIHEPDAWELEIARRQSLLLLSSSSTEETQQGRSGSGSMQNIRQDSVSNSNDSAKSIKVDQCLMTDSDHLYDRTLTPTRERRSQSLDRSREFGTQTEMSDTGATSEEKTGSGLTRSHESLLNDVDKQTYKKGNNKSKETKTKKFEHEKFEKPRWGANPVKKQYLKQSEKDPNYQQRMRRRNERLRLGLSGTGGETTEDSEDYHSVPFPRIRSRKSPTRASYNQKPLKALHTKTDNQLMDNNMSENLNLNRRSSALKKNYPSDPSLNSNSKGYKHPSSIVNRNLGSIGGLNSCGVSEESGSGFTSPSLGIRTTNTGGSGSASGSLRSGISHSPEVFHIPEYLPAFSSEYIPQKEFDEIPINAGKIAPGIQKTYGVGGKTVALESISTESDSLTLTSSDQTHQIPVVKNPPARKTQATKPPKAKITQTNAKAKQNESKTNKLQGRQKQEKTEKRSESPPVPALLKKMQMGFHPDESGRLSSLPSEMLSPIPTVPIGSPHLELLNLDLNKTLNMKPPATAESSSSHTSHSTHRSQPKVDIDIAITHATNPDLQRILKAVEEQERLSELEESHNTTDSTEQTLTPRNTAREELKLPDILTGRSSQSNRSHLSRPMTSETELSLKVQEDFIRDLMSQKEVQEQLSARESELSEKGIIEFNIRLPSSWEDRYKRKASVVGPGGGGDGRRSSSKSLNNEEYRDPLISERRRNTANWLHGLEETPNHTQDLLLTNLSSLKKGIKVQQSELAQTSYEYSTDTFTE